MKKSLFTVAAAIAIGAVSIFALSPYFTESTLDEAIPAGAIIQPKMEDKKAVMMMEEEEVIQKMSFVGTFVGVGDGIHDAQGDVYTIPLEDGTDVLRLENFKSTNGPDLYVYLSTDKYASEFINLGELKANSGNQNYNIPDDVDIEKYNQVLIWCKAFGVLFGNAELSSN